MQDKEEETLQGSQLKNCRNEFSLVVRKSQETSNSAYITTSHLGEFPEKSSALIQNQTPAYSVAKHYWNIKWTGFCGQVKLKRAFWHTRVRFVAHRD